MAQIQSSIVFNNFPGTNSQVTAALLNNHVNNATLVSGAIADQVSATPVATDSILIQRATALNKTTIQQIINLVPLAVPIGSIVMWGTVTPPTGWLELNGQPSPASLQSLYGLTLPDMRGYFPRGWANGSVIDPQPTRNILSTQVDVTEAHSHTYDKVQATSVNLAAGTLPYNVVSSITTASTGLQPATTQETRPINIALMFIVKYQ